MSLRRSTCHDAPRNRARAAAVALLLCTAVQAAGDDTDWPTYQGNEDHSGFIDRKLDPSSLAVRWAEQPMPHAVFGLAIGAGHVFVTPWTYFEPDGALVALDLSSGQESWRKTYPSLYSINQPAFDPVTSRVFVQTGRGFDNNLPYLRCYDAATGEFIWRAEIGAQWERYLAPTVIDGAVYVNAGYYGGAYAFGASDGEQRWFTALSQYDEWTPTRFGDSKVLAFTDKIAVLDRATGQVDFEVSDPAFNWSGWSARATPVVTSSGLAIVANGQRLVALDLVNKNVAWSPDIETSGQVSYDGNALFVVAQGALSVRDPESGVEIWRWTPPAGEFLQAPLIVFRNYVIARTTGSMTYLVDRQSHTSTHSIPASGELAYANDTLIIGASNGTVTALTLRSERVVFEDGFE